MIYCKQATGTVDEVQQRIEEASAAHKFGVLGTYDLKQKMNAKGVEFSRECRVIEVCNPVKAQTVLTVNPLVATALPCRIAVYQDDQGNAQIAMVNPSALMNLFGSSELAPTAAEVEQTMIAIIDDAAK